jgi:hypothetical protein
MDYCFTLWKLGYGVVAIPLLSHWVRIVQEIYLELLHEIYQGLLLLPGAPSALATPLGKPSWALNKEYQLEVCQQDNQSMGNSHCANCELWVAKEGRRYAQGLSVHGTLQTENFSAQMEGRRFARGLSLHAIVRVSHSPGKRKKKKSTHRIGGEKQTKGLGIASADNCIGFSPEFVKVRFLATTIVVPWVFNVVVHRDRLHYRSIRPLQ